MMWTVKMVGLGLVASSLSLELLVWLRRRLWPERTINQVLFFPSETVCVEHIFTPSYSCLCSLPHGVETSFSRLLQRILTATSSLDLCVFAFSNMNLCRAVLALRDKGVTVRVITDKEYAAISGSQIGVLRKAGIRVRCAVGAVHMHHKFAVLDGQLLLTGSLNWTLSAVHSNMENVVITEEPEQVQSFVGEFQRLWVHSDPAQFHRSVDRPPTRVISDR